MPTVATEIMESLYQHRVLSTSQIHDLHTPGTHASYTRRLLTTLAHVGAVEYAVAGGRLKALVLDTEG